MVNDLGYNVEVRFEQVFSLLFEGLHAAWTWGSGAQSDKAFFAPVHDPPASFHKEPSVTAFPPPLPPPSPFFLASGCHTRGQTCWMPESCAGVMRTGRAQSKGAVIPPSTLLASPSLCRGQHASHLPLPVVPLMSSLLLPTHASLAPPYGPPMVPRMVPILPGE